MAKQTKRYLVFLRSCGTCCGDRPQNSSRPSICPGAADGEGKLLMGVHGKDAVVSTSARGPLCTYVHSSVTTVCNPPAELYAEGCMREDDGGGEGGGCSRIDLGSNVVTGVIGNTLAMASTSGLGRYCSLVTSAPFCVALVDWISP